MHVALLRFVGAKGELEYVSKKRGSDSWKSFPRKSFYKFILHTNFSFTQSDFMQTHAPAFNSIFIQDYCLQPWNGLSNQVLFDTLFFIISHANQLSVEIL